MKELHEALMDAFRSEKDLEMMLSYELEWKLNQIAGGDNYKEIVFNLINYADAQGQIENLFKAARKHNPGNPKLRNFQNIYLNCITQYERDELKFILEKIEFKIIKFYYFKTLPDGSTEDNGELKIVYNISDIIYNLDEYYPKHKSGVPSIIKLAEYVVNSINRDSNEYEKLVNWLNKLSSKLGIEILLHSKVQPEPIKSNYSLLFLIYPYTGKRFRLEAAYTQDEIPHPLDYLPDTTRIKVSVKNQQIKGILCNSFEEIPQKIDKIIKYFIEKISADDFIIEIYLPYTHLYVNIDDCNITDDINEPVAILQDFKVLLHSIDRITGPMNYKNLKEGWKQLSEILDKQPTQDILNQNIETIGKSQNWSDLTKKLKKKIGVKLTKPMLNNITEQENFILTVLRGGVPFAFWIKCNPSRSRKLEQIDCYLALDYLNNNLQKLIEEICYLRREAYRETKKSKPLGCYLGFLCDDPEKIQKIKQLASYDSAHHS